MTVDWRHLPSLASLRAFDAVARHGGFTGAARALNVTHPAIAQQVRALEREMGMALVQRLGRAVSLTAEGERLARVLDEGFGTIAAGVESLRRDDQTRGLRVATTIFTAQMLILPRITEFWAAHPEIEVSLVPSQTPVDLLRDGFDVAIRSFRSEGPGIEALPLARSRWMVVGAPSLLAPGHPDPSRLPWIWINDKDPGREFLARLGINADAVHKVVVGNALLELSAAVLGLGLAISTEVAARAELQAGRLIELPLPDLPSADYYAIVPAAPRRPAIDTFVTWVRGLF